MFNFSFYASGSSNRFNLFFCGLLNLFCFSLFSRLFLSCFLNSLFNVLCFRLCFRLCFSFLRSFLFHFLCQNLCCIISCFLSFLKFYIIFIIIADLRHLVICAIEILHEVHSSLVFLFFNIRRCAVNDLSPILGSYSSFL